MAYDPIADGEGLTAAWMLANVSDQVISQVTAGTHPTGTEGQFIYETDTGSVKGHDGSAFVEFGRLSGAGTWTPQIDQGASTNISKTVTTAFYVRFGNIVLAWANLALTASGSAGSAVTVTLPVAPSGHNANDSIGGGQVNDSSSATNALVVDVWFNSGSTVYFQAASVASAGRWGAVPNVALASGDSIRFHVMYRVA